MKSDSVLGLSTKRFGNMSMRTVSEIIRGIKAKWKCIGRLF